MSRRNPLGWAYPAGAEHDPNAPYNQTPEPEDCPICHEPCSDDDQIWPYCSEECAARAEPDDPRDWGDEGGGVHSW